MFIDIRQFPWFCIDFERFVLMFVDCYELFLVYMDLYVFNSRSWISIGYHVVALDFVDKDVY